MDDRQKHGPSDLIQGGATAPDEPGFAEPSFLPPEPSAPASPYRVLARKYRPETFTDLIGQEAMVRTVSNAFLTNRIPQAWMLTGVRGVGKTTTARILARALNYASPDGSPGSPTVAMPGLGLHCQAIMESRHVDVMELDAASHTGVENMRQITDAIRYAPVQARYKVYIIDEVHMLSASAFNAFLKTLEEPPPHAKFVLATTEIRKVPVTILSRCQRFDLRRVETGVLAAHLARICAAETVEAEPDALAAIARAAEGSVRDALSLLDQAVADGSGIVSGDAVRQMLGQADRGQVVDLFEAVMRGDLPTSLAVLRSGWEGGAEPAQMLSDLAAFTHLVTRLKLVPEAARDPALTEVERVRGSDLAGRLSVRALSRGWQIVSKAVVEVGGSGRPLAAAEMALVRLAYAADLPTPDEALKALRSGAAPRPVAAIPPPPALNFPPSLTAASPPGATAAAAVAVLPVAIPETAPAGVKLGRFEDVVALAGEKRDIALKSALERDVRLVRFEEGRIELALTATASRNLPNQLSRLLGEWTGRPWKVALSNEAGAPTFDELRRERERERRHDAANHPLVRKVLASFPGSEIVDVRHRAAVAEAGPEGEGALPAPPDDEAGDGEADDNWSAA